MALSATGRTLRIRRQSNYVDGEDEEMGEAPLAGETVVSAPPRADTGSRITVRVHLDGPVTDFVSASVGGFEFPPDDDDMLSSDDEIFKDVRTYVRQTMGKPAIVRAEAGICGGGDVDEGIGMASRAATAWLEGSAGSNYVTVRHPLADCPIDVPPLPTSEVAIDRDFHLPSTCRHWFSPDFVSDIERAQLVLFGVSEGLYFDLRTQIIDAYNADPSKYLSVRQAREATGFGEVGVLTKVWAFLDFWGIINFHSDPSTAPRYSKKLIDYPIGLPAEKLRKVVCCCCQAECLFSAFALKREAAPLVPLHQIEGARFCAACIHARRYPLFFDRNSFAEIDVTLPGTVTKDFSEEETMKLMEGVDRYGSDWESVAKLVGGGKTAAQCLLHFVQIPMHIDTHMEAFGGTTQRIVPTKNPFRNETSPILQLVKTICETVPEPISRAVAGA